MSTNQRSEIPNEVTYCGISRTVCSVMFFFVIILIGCMLISMYIDVQYKSIIRSQSMIEQTKQTMLRWCHDMHYYCLEFRDVQFKTSSLNCVLKSLEVVAVCGDIQKLCWDLHTRFYLDE